MGHVKNEPAFTGVRCCPKLLIWIKPEIPQRFRWLTRIDKSIALLFLLSLSWSVRLSKRSVWGSRFLVGECFTFAISGGSKGLPFLSPRCCWAVAQGALLCIIFQQAALWGKKFLYFAAPFCSIPGAIATRCSKLKPICWVLCFLEAEGSRYFTKLAEIWNWEYIIWVLNTFGLPFWLS